MWKRPDYQRCLSFPPYRVERLARSVDLDPNKPLYRDQGLLCGLLLKDVLGEDWPYPENLELASPLLEVSDLYEQLGAEEHFVECLRHSSQVIAAFPELIVTVQQLQGLKWVEEPVLVRVEELLEEGELQEIDELYDQLEELDTPLR